MVRSPTRETKTVKFNSKNFNLKIFYDILTIALVKDYLIYC